MFAHRALEHLFEVFYVRYQLAGGRCFFSRSFGWRQALRLAGKVHVLRVLYYDIYSVCLSLQECRVRMHVVLTEVSSRMDSQSTGELLAVSICGAANSGYFVQSRQTSEWMDGQHICAHNVPPYHVIFPRKVALK